MTRTRWQGWTLVNNDDLVLQVFTPIIFPTKRQAEQERKSGECIVRCELRIIK